jgi:cytochrome b561
MALHWLLALLIVANFALGMYMHELPFSMTRLKLYNWHKWAGVVILSLSAAAPAVAPDAPAAGRPAHAGLAAAARHMARTWRCTCCSLPCRWPAGPTARRRVFPSCCFGVLPLPDFVPDRELSEVLKPCTMRWPMALAAVVVVHVAGAAQAPVRRPRRPAATHAAGAPPVCCPHATDETEIPEPCLPAPCFPSPSPWPCCRRLLLPALAQPKPAGSWQAAGSEIAFTTRQMGVPVEGRFGKFSAQIALDPKKPETGSVASASTPAARASAAPNSTPRCPSRPG